MPDIWNKNYIFAPSLICLDLCNLEAEIRSLEQMGVEMLHVDLIDGYFSPSMPIGLDTIKQLRKITDMPFDVHLMAKDQDFFIRELVDIGISQLTFHLECEEHVDMRLNMLRSNGIRAGVALKPSTPITSLNYILEKCDTVLLMLINPGFAGNSYEKQVPYARQKIVDLDNLIREQKVSTRIELDGRISKENIRDFKECGASIFVAGTTCIAKDNMKDSIDDLIRLCN